jgi:hypothetical protein
MPRPPEPPPTPFDPFATIISPTQGANLKSPTKDQFRLVLHRTYGSGGDRGGEGRRTSFASAQLPRANPPSPLLMRLLAASRPSDCGAAVAHSSPPRRVGRGRHVLENFRFAMTGAGEARRRAMTD